MVRKPKSSLIDCTVTSWNIHATIKLSPKNKLFDPRSKSYYGDNQLTHRSLMIINTNTNLLITLSSSTMSDNITLLCLVESDSKEDIFKVITRINDDIIDLKKKIKGELHPLFENIVSKDIVLWKVNIPIDEGTMEIEIFIKDMQDRLKLSIPIKKICNCLLRMLQTNLFILLSNASGR